MAWSICGGMPQLVYERWHTMGVFSALDVTSSKRLKLCCAVRPEVRAEKGNFKYLCVGISSGTNIPIECDESEIYLTSVLFR